MPGLPSPPPPGPAIVPPGAIPARTPGIPTRPLIVAAVALVFVVGLGWVALGQGGQQAPVTSIGTASAAANPRAPRPAKMVAVFNQATFSTRYTVAIDDQLFPVDYFELRTGRGARRYSAEILLRPGDRIILDDDSVSNLEARTACLVPATLYSRSLTSKPTAA